MVKETEHRQVDVPGDVAVDALLLRRHGFSYPFVPEPNAGEPVQIAAGRIEAIGGDWWMELWGWQRSAVVTLLAWAVTAENEKLRVVSLTGIPRESGKLLLDKLRQAGRRVQHTQGSA